MLPRETLGFNAQCVFEVIMLIATKVQSLPGAHTRNIKKVKYDKIRSKKTHRSIVNSPLPANKEALGLEDLVKLCPVRLD